MNIQGVLASELKVGETVCDLSDHKRENATMFKVSKIDNGIKKVFMLYVSGDIGHYNIVNGIVRFELNGNLWYRIIQEK